MSARCQDATALTDEPWNVLPPLLPAPPWRPGGPGRPPCARRHVVHGILYGKQMRRQTGEAVRHRADQPPAQRT